MSPADLATGVESPAPFAAEGGKRTFPKSRREPFETLDDLMAAVEALCPRWPDRANFDSRGEWRL